MINVQEWADNFISDVDDFFAQWEPSTATPIENMWGHDVEK